MNKRSATLAEILAAMRDLCKSAQVDKCARPGPKSRYPNSLFITINLLRYLFGINSESAFLRYLMKHHADKLPEIPEQSWFNRKTKHLTTLIDKIYQLLLKRLGVAEIEIRIVDATGVPVVKLHRARRCRSFERRTEVGYGYCAAKHEYYYGEKMTLLLTPQGIPAGHALAPANHHDVRAFKAQLPRLAPYMMRKVIVGDKGYYDGELDTEVIDRYQGLMVTPEKKRHQKRNSWWKRQLLKLRKIVETVIGQLQDHMRLDDTRAKSQRGLETRVQSLIVSFTFGIYWNALHGRELLAIKSVLT